MRSISLSKSIIVYCKSGCRFSTCFCALVYTWPSTDRPTHQLRNTCRHRDTVQSGGFLSFNMSPTLAIEWHSIETRYSICKNRFLAFGSKWNLWNYRHVDISGTGWMNFRLEGAQLSHNEINIIMNFIRDTEPDSEMSKSVYFELSAHLSTFLKIFNKFMSKDHTSKPQASQRVLY